MNEPVRRLFFALWPSRATHSLLVDAIRPARLELGKADARLVDTANLHITLAFLGNMADRQYRCVASAADRVEAAGFELCLDHWGFFRRARVAFMAPSKVPVELRQLVTGLWDAVGSCGLDADPRPYRPHLTLARKVEKPLRLAAPEGIYWRPADFVLVSSQTLPAGPVYRVLRRWPVSAVSPGIDHA